MFVTIDSIENVGVATSENIASAAQALANIPNQIFTNVAALAPSASDLLNIPGKVTDGLSIV